MPNPADLETEPAGDQGSESDRRARHERGKDTALDFRAVFDFAPDVYLVLAPDPPRFTILAANDARLRATGTSREDVIGAPLFEAFPDNPSDAGASGVRNLRASLLEVIRTGRAHRMALQKYDLRGPSGAFEERWWAPLNSPVFDEQGRLACIIHRVEDVTERVLAGRRFKALESVAEETTRRLTRETEARESVEAVLAKLRESEERYRVLVDMIPQSVWTTDAAGHHTFFSRRWYEFSGATYEQSRGEEWTSFIHPDDRERMEQRWRRSIATGEPYEIEYRFRSAEGDYHWFLGRAMPLRNAAGEIVEWFGTATDISEQKRLEEERERLLARERAAREEVTTILESITDAFFTIDRDWRFTYVNHEAERLLKRSRAELVTRCVWEEFPEAVGATFEREYRRAMAEQTTVHFEECYNPLGVWLDVHAYPSEDGLAVFFRDVTRRKHAEDALRESERKFRALAAERERLLEGEREARAEAERRREALERVTESRTRLMRGFSHDVKNPLGAADGHAQLLEDGILGELSAKQLDSVRRIRRSISTSLRLIQDLLELARAEAGQLDIECVTTDVGAAAREVADDFQAQAVGAGLELKCHAGAKVLAETDPTRVRQIIANLLSNAVKYAPHGTVTVEAGVRDGGGPRPGSWVTASVVDTGPGIPVEKREHIFQEFTRLDPEAQAGAGVGLAISRRIAQLLGGDLTVESEVGRGSTFTLWLPPASSGGGRAQSSEIAIDAPVDDTHRDGSGDAPRDR